MKKIYYQDLLNRTYKEQIEIKRKYHNENVTIELKNSVFRDAKIEFGVNWSALGTVGAEEARQFANRLNETIALVNSLNKEFEDTEVEL